MQELIEKVENKINEIEDLKMKMDKTISEFEKQVLPKM